MRFCAFLAILVSLCVDAIPNNYSPLIVDSAKEIGIEARPASGPSSYVIPYVSDIKPAFLQPIESSGEFIYGNGAVYDSNFRALSVPATSNITKILIPHIGSGYIYDGFNLDQSGNLTIGHAYTFYSCIKETYSCPYLFATPPGTATVPQSAGDCTTVTLHLQPDTIPPAPIKSYYLQNIVNTDSPAAGLYLKQSVNNYLAFVSNDPTAFYHENFSKVFYNYDFSVINLNGSTEPGRVAFLDFVQDDYQNFILDDSRHVTFFDRETTNQQFFFACNFQGVYVLYSAPSSLSGPENMPGCSVVNLVAVEQIIQESTIAPSSSTLPPFSSTVSISSNSSISESFTSTSSLSSSEPQSTVSTVEPTTMVTEMTGTSTQSLASIQSTGVTTTSSAMSTSSLATQTSFSSIPATPTSGILPENLSILDSSNSALKGLVVIPDENNSSGLLVLANKNDAITIQLINGFLQYITGVYADVNNESEKPVIYVPNSTAPFGFFSQFWSLGNTTLRKRQTQVNELTFTTPDGRSAIFYVCQLGGKSGNFVLFSTFNSFIPSGCFSVSLGVTPLLSTPPSQTTSTILTSTISNRFQSDICVNAFGVNICTSGIFRLGDSGNFTAVDDFSISLGTTFLVCAANSTDCHPVDSLPITDLPCYAVTCTCSVCCSIMPINSAANANPAATAAAGVVQSRASALGGPFGLNADNSKSTPGSVNSDSLDSTGADMKSGELSGSMNLVSASGAPGAISSTGSNAFTGAASSCTCKTFNIALSVCITILLS